MRLAGWPRRRSTFDVDRRRAEAADLQRQLVEPGVWDDPARGQRLTTQLSRLNDAISRYDRLAGQVDDLRAADELLALEEDPELARELTTKLHALGAELEKVELANLLSGEYDGNDAVASIHSGAGGI